MRAIRDAAERGVVRWGGNDVPSPELLARVARVNSELGRMVVELLHRHDGGELPAEGVRELGRRLADLGAELLAQADVLERPVIEGRP